MMLSYVVFHCIILYPDISYYLVFIILHSVAFSVYHTLCYIVVKHKPERYIVGRHMDIYKPQ